MNNTEMIPGETMFEYLKRKKKIMLQRTLSRNKGCQDHQSQYSRRDSKDGQGDFQKTKRNQCKENYPKSSLKGNESQSITPKRVSILEEEKRPATRSFLQMISPIRSKSPIQKEAESSIKNSPKFQKKSNAKDNFTKKAMMEKINNLGQLLQSLIKSGKNLKEKSHFLFVELKPFFRHLQNCQESTFQKKTQVVKAKLKALQTIFGEFRMESVQETLDSFYLNLSQYVNELQGISQAQIKQNKASLLSEVVSVKQTQITELQENNRKLERDLQNSIKRYEKLENSFQIFKEQAFSRIQAANHQEIQKYQHYETRLQEQIDRNALLRQQLEDLAGCLKRKECQIKKLQFDHQKYKEESLNTITKVKSEQEEFLLNEIMVLKKEFNSDITEITKLHKIKEEQYLNRIKEYASQLEKMKSKVEELTLNTIQMEEMSNNTKAQASRFKKQNQMLATDMHRINQQLYQHWLALKDIKTLAMRLDTFHKFKKIYEELLFNEQLFL